MDIAPVSLHDSPIEPDWFDYVERCAKGTKGALSFCRIGDSIAQWVALLPLLSEASRIKVGLWQQSAFFGSTIFVWPYIITNINDLRHSIDALINAENVAKAAKKVFINSLKLLNSGMLVLTHMHEFKWIRLGASFSPVNFALCLTSFITDGSSGWKQFDKLEEYERKKREAPSSEESAYFQGKKNIAWLKLIKNASSVAAASIGILALILGFVSVGSPIAAIIALFLFTTEVVPEGMVIFYKKRLEESHRNLALLSARI